jgi:hypothetical protein
LLSFADIPTYSFHSLDKFSLVGDEPPTLRNVLLGKLKLDFPHGRSAVSVSSFANGA